MKLSEILKGINGIEKKFRIDSLLEICFNVANLGRIRLNDLIKQAENLESENVKLNKEVALILSKNKELADLMNNTFMKVHEDDRRIIRELKEKLNKPGMYLGSFKNIKCEFKKPDIPQFKYKLDDMVIFLNKDGKIKTGRIKSTIFTYSTDKREYDISCPEDAILTTTESPQPQTITVPTLYVNIDEDRIIKKLVSDFKYNDLSFL